MYQRPKDVSQGCSQKEPPELVSLWEVVPYVDLGRYLGIWYEILATIPQRFQKGCVGVTAEYSLRENGDIEVVNTCIQDTLGGESPQGAWESPGGRQGDRR